MSTKEHAKLETRSPKTVHTTIQSTHCADFLGVSKKRRRFRCLGNRQFTLRAMRVLKWWES